MTLAVALLVGLDVRAFLNTPINAGPDESTLMVKPGSNLKAIAQQLHGRGLLERPAYLVWLARVQNPAATIKAGEYVLPPGIMPAQLLELLASGRVKHYSLTVVEGWSFGELVDALARNEVIEHTLRDATPAQIMERIGYPGVHPEGRFYPDTYRFPRGTTDVAFLQRAYRQMEKALADEWAQRDEGLPLQSPEQALILASIVEKETGMADERPQIAGLFLRRLRLGMRLQSDPTVIYGLGRAYDGNIRKRDLLHDTPYNSYTRAGLPPTPIALPGIDAIRAVLHPADGEALYFVARGDGSHVFSATLIEHNAAVKKYQINAARAMRQKGH